MKHLWLFLSFMMLAACNKSPNIPGRWVMPVPGMETTVQGFELSPDGTATSINTATLLYKNWALKGKNTIILTGDSIGNGQTIHFVEYYRLSQPDKDTLILTTPAGYSQTYTRE